MAIEIILLPIRASDHTQILLDSALLAAQRFEAHLCVLYSGADPRDLLPYATLGLSKSMHASIIDAARRGAEDQAAALEQQFEQTCAGVQVPLRAAGAKTGAGAEWLRIDGKRSEVVARMGRLADLVIVPRPRSASETSRTFEAALRDTGCPVLLAPRQGMHLPWFEHVAIAWNGSAQAARAVRSALPALEAAKQVSILTSEKRLTIQPSASELSDYLALHGISAAVAVFDAEERVVGEVILEQTHTLGADTLLTGAFGMSTLRAFVMGGVTRYLLSHADLPVLMTP